MGEWRQLSCYDCEAGQVSSYTIGGGDFCGADECRTCNGSGKIWCSPKGSLAKWPGGPFIGKIGTMADTAKDVRKQDQ